MRRAHSIEQVRAAEKAAVASLPDGALMQRAAAGLANAVVGLLRQRGAGGAYGKRVVLLVGSGDSHNPTGCSVMATGYLQRNLKPGSLTSNQI